MAAGDLKFSTDPELEGKVRDVVGLYLNPPEKAVVLCVEEKSQIQALNRTAPILPLRPGLPEKATHDYQRNGTTTLFAALEVATGKVTDQCYERHGKAEFLDFLKKVAKAYPCRELHVVLELPHPQAHRYQPLARQEPRITLHFTPPSGSWLNLVEVFFGIIDEHMFGIECGHHLRRRARPGLLVQGRRAPDAATQLRAAAPHPSVE